MPPSRRRARSPKLVAATALLTVSAVAASAALVSSPALAGASLLGVGVGIVAAVLMFAEIVVIRRAWALDRAQVADGYRTESKRQHESNLSFVQGMGSRLALQENQIGLMQDALLTSEIEIALSRERLSAEKARVQALESDAQAAASDLASARSDLLAAQDALAVSESAGVAARAEIIAWQEVSETSPEHTQRRLA